MPLRNQRFRNWRYVGDPAPGRFVDETGRDIVDMEFVESFTFDVQRCAENPAPGAGQKGARATIVLAYTDYPLALEYQDHKAAGTL